MEKLLKAVCFGLAAAVCLILSASAGESSSRWTSNQYTSSRLFVGGYDAQEKVLHLGWHVKLRDGWKTYWRTPGEAGIPPTWHWNNDGPLRKISVRWPVPERKKMFGYVSNIYRDELVIPVDVYLEENPGVVKLALAMDYMICREVCIPLNGEYSLEIRDPAALKVTPYQTALLQKYRGRVPRVLDRHDFSVRDDGKGTLEVRLEQPADGQGKFRSLFIEGPDDTYFSSPVPAEGGKALLFEIPYTAEAQHQTLVGRKVVLTLVPESGQAVEIHATVAGD